MGFGCCFADVSTRNRVLQKDIYQAHLHCDANISPSLEVEKQARLNLEEKLASRSINNSDRETLRTKLIVFKGTTIDIFIYGAGSSDALSLAGDIKEVLQLAAWKMRMWNPIGSVRVIKGVLVTTRLGSDHAVEAPAAQLIDALNAVGIKTSPYEQFIGDEAPDNIVGVWEADKTAPIRMMIGSKP